ncbi:MAG: hypothetical protein KJP15_06135 [Gammaproteobacteria bacterium]|nr:hypothetical protein [Gammaproteobacteria bacterium]
MNKSILHSAITAALAVNIAACSSSGTDVAGIGGSGITPTASVFSSGTITGFGSIFVNGVKFETGASTFSIDDNSGTEDDLAIGMVVTVTGSINEDGVSGTADSVSFDDQLQGPVSNVSAVDADGITRTITVLGTVVLLDINTTSFDVSGTVSGSFNFNNINVEDNVEVSGFFDSAGVLKATRVELKEDTFVAGSSIVELKGTITALTGTTFSLEGVSGITVDASSASIEDLSGLANGAVVEVKGTCLDSSCSTLTAMRVEGQSLGFDDDDEVEIEGIITRFVNDSDFDVNGFPVNASNAVKEPTSFVLGIDKEVEVEGTVVNGVLVATKIADEGGDIKIAATVTAVDSAAGSFELTPVSGQPAIIVEIDTSTEIEDDIGEINSAALLDNLAIGTDFLTVQGYEDDGTGVIVATKVDRDTAGDIILQGRLQQITENVSVTVLGVSFGIQDDPANSANDETDFEDANDREIEQTLFISAAPVGTIIKIKDKNESGAPANGIADEIEIEN